MEIFIKCSSSSSLNIIPRLFFFVFMCCSSSLFFHGGIAATENKTDPIEVEELGAIFRKWKIDGEKTWNISSTNPCTDHVVNDSNDERVNEAVYGSLDILCLCDNNTSVCNIIKLSANDLKISGTIPNELENLTKLVYLDLSKNNFNGPLPSEIGNLENIQTLYLSECNFNGSLPSEIGNLKNIQTLSLSGNNFGGKVPDTLWNLTNLNYLYLSECNFNGSLPSEIGNLKNIQTLDLEDNSFQGSIPSSIGNLVDLEELDLEDNSFQGSIPSSIGNLVDLEELYLSNNSFEGEILNSLGNLTKLKILDLEGNSFQGSIPSSIGNLVDLEELDLSRNNFSSLLPQEIGNLNELKKLDLSENHFTGSIPKILIDRRKQGLLNMSLQGNPGLCDDQCEKSSSNKTKIIIIAVICSTIAVFSVIIFIGWKVKRSARNTLSEEPLRGGPLQGNIELNGLEVNTYRFPELITATENFKPANKLGEGGFGVVYKGTLYNGDTVAVKKLLTESIQGNEQFIAEVATISEVRQKNLVKLHGCCCQGNKRMLVYEYMENGSLDTALYGRTGQLELDWDIRFMICLGIAKGLNYLHQYSRHRIIHRDIKSSNILLDQHLNPKICDFGLAKLYEDKMTHITTRAAGTYGYLAPEYALSGHLTEKVDVFAFGIVVLEIISGKCCIDDSYVSFGSNQTYIIQWVWNIHENMDDDLAMVDPKLKSFNKDEVCRIIQVALLCTQMDSMSRPSMSQVIAMLNGEKDIGTLPSKPSYLMFWHVSNSSREVDDIEFQPDQFDSRQEISSCSYSQSMPLRHAQTGSSEQKDEDYTKTF